MQKLKELPQDKKIAWVFGFGLSLCAFVGLWSDYIYVPTIGLALTAIISFMLIDRKEYRQRMSLGNWRVSIPLLVVLLSILASGIARYLSEYKAVDLAASILMPVYLFGVYLVSRLFGKEVMRSFAWVGAIEGFSVLILAMVHWGIKNGGIASATNYNIAIGLLSFGLIAAIEFREKALGFACAGGILMTGAQEGLVVGGLLLAAWAIKNWSKRVAWGMGLGFVGLTFVAFTPLYHLNPINSTIGIADGLVHGRIGQIQDMWANFAWLGHGYQMVNFPADGIVHNVPLVIVQQVGIAAAIAWVILIALLFKRWVYLFAAIVGMGIFDHFLFTQLMPISIAVFGVASGIDKTNKNKYNTIK